MIRIPSTSTIPFRASSSAQETSASSYPFAETAPTSTSSCFSASSPPSDASNLYKTEKNSSSFPFTIENTKESFDEKTPLRTDTLSPKPSLFQSNLTPMPTLPRDHFMIPRNLLNYTYEMLDHIKETKKETEIEAIKAELIELIERNLPDKKDVEDLSLKKLSNLCYKFSQFIVRDYRIRYGVFLSKEEKKELKNELALAIYSKTSLLTKNYKELAEKYSYFDKPITDSDIYG